MGFAECFHDSESILMEGALGERLKREYHLSFDENVVMANLVYLENGRYALNRLWTEYAEIAVKYHLPFLATTPTRRVNKKNVESSKYDASIIFDNVSFLKSVKQTQSAEMFIGGLLGCHGDAYTGENALGREASESFHDWEVKKFAEAGVDFLYAALFPDVQEAAGIALSIEKYNVPYIISFTIRRNGCLVDGTTICDAIHYIDSITYNKPICYMTNCVHPIIVNEALSQPFNCNEIVRKRFLGIQANTSPLSYDELDHSVELKTSDPIILANEMVKLRDIQPIKIFGGCCGTDSRHMKEIAKRLGGRY